MAVDLTLAEQRSELEAVLASKVFSRSPIAGQILRYVCERHFAGQSHEIKEYTIAVEALGRPSDFDKSRDSIIRVEAHRLRKRLQEFYREEGARRPIRITIPPGSYVPQFVPASTFGHPATEAPASETTPDPKSPKAEQRPSRGAPSVSLAAHHTAPEATTAEPIADERSAAAQPDALPLLPAHVVPEPKRRIAFPVGLALAVVALIGVTAYFLRDDRRTHGATEAIVFPPAPHLPDDEIRILCGNATPRYVDRLGNAWVGDRYFEGGDAAAATPRAIAFTEDTVIYLHSRRGVFSYRIPLKHANYELRLHFAETVFGENNASGGGETSRFFNVDANGKRLLEQFDVIGDAGGSNTADIKVFKDIRPGPDGKLRLDFVSNHRDLPFVNAIELIPAPPGRMLPVRIRARESQYTDARGQVWSADRFFRGGVINKRQGVIGEGGADQVCGSERFGNFGYHIPVVAESTYTLRLRFCENYFGSDRPGKGGAGSRLFNVHLNGQTLLSSFDIFKEAGSLKPVEKTFVGVNPTPQGKLVFTFVPIRNYALINSIEVLEEPRPAARTL